MPEPKSSKKTETYTIADVSQLKALSHPLRLKILETIALEPMTTKQVAIKLDEKPTRLYHHVAALEDAGLIRLVSTRPVRGTTEKYYQAVAEMMRVDPALMAGQPAAGLSVVQGILENVQRDLAALAGQEDDPDDEDEALFLQVEVYASAERMLELREKIDGLLNEMQEESDGDDDEHRRLVLGWYPAP